MPRFNPDRRRFIKLSAAFAGGSLVLGVNWSCSSDTGGSRSADGFAPNAWLRISPDNQVTVIVAESEMGQGPYTLMPMMVAEELEVDWRQVEVERASIDPVYGYQFTGGSTSIRKGWLTLREAGAIAREMLLQAAANRMDVDYSECRAESGRIEHLASGRSMAYGDLVEAASRISIPDQVPLKDYDEFKLLGRSLARKDVPDKLNGSAIYGIDVRAPGQLFATVIHCPVFGGKLREFDAAKALEMNETVDVFSIDEGLAVVATDTWSAFEAAKRIEVDWDLGDNRDLSSQSYLELLEQADSDQAEASADIGDPENAFRESESVHRSRYVQPFQAHMTMEPMNATAHFREDGNLEIWAPTQSPSRAYDTARALVQSRPERLMKKIRHKLLGGYDDSVIVNTTLLGGGFGRRLEQDYVAEVVQIASRFDQPVQLVWPREQDVRHDHYHPMTVHQMRAALDENGFPVAWEHTIRGGDVRKHGAEHAYRIPNQRIKVIDVGKIVPRGQWRSVAPHYNVFAVEHFIDELSRRAGVDPLDYRLRLLDQSAREKGVLERAAELMNWGGSRNRDRYFGIAAARSFGSYVAQAIEVQQYSEFEFKIARVICAIDCGFAINPAIVEQQMESSIIFALTAATKSKITLAQGRVEQSNFHDYPVMRIDEVPPIEVAVLKNREKPMGIGEPGVPPVAPALANALFASTGKPVKDLPINLRA